MARGYRPRGSGLLGGIPLVAVLVVLAAALVVSSLAAVGLGPVSIPPGEVTSIVGAHLAGGGAPGPFDFIVWNLRVPRVLQGVFVGAGLAVAGLLTQAMVRNPLGEPFVLGLTSGAGVGAVLVLTTFGVGVAGLLTLPLAAFGGAVVTALVVFGISRTAGRIQAGRMVMSGIAVGQLLAGVISFLLLRTKDVDAQQQILFWILGSLAGAQWPLALTCAAVVLVLVVLAAAGAGRLNLLVLGDDGAAALGLDAARARAMLLVVVTLLTGTVVAVSGSIGFIGLIVPNLTRLLVGADHRRALPVTALLGALVIVWSDTAARLLLAPTELPIGILTAAVGVPLFLVVLRRSAAGTVGLS
ncbi:iron chelate uptake ABC transporter family permease subunit [Amycolatopsis rhizosphaerae]|uniref:Iron chelate uptake ABC transporter family permease subunit n=1 Tax=Amycolatopsis rhizosphaerae TaxID=2053003 RepID=A0A558DHQ6_9PSEU|nr:iron chelate uptake ABC transporter family permease subunit [Amycolatopsis rhizosphaerae]TVT60516.1 iron chelate uptake ABC transporter family permease subunit [Amycolatopsis rhizosphaerae]